MAHDDALVAIKGTQHGLLVALSPTAEWLRITADLAKRIDEQGAFFNGAQITVDVGERPVPKHELSGLKALLERRGLRLWAVVTSSDTTLDAASTLDVKTHLPVTANTPQAMHPVPAAPAEDDGIPGTMVRRTLRSGASVRSDGHVVIYGDVNPGAQVVAGGDVLVWGRLRGTVHAGATGDPNAVVCALDMAPTQLRIADFIATSPADKRRQPRPEVAFVRDQHIVVEAWRP